MENVLQLTSACVTMGTMENTALTVSVSVSLCMFIELNVKKIICELHHTVIGFSFNKTFRKIEF